MSDKRLNKIKIWLVLLRQRPFIHILSFLSFVELIFISIYVLHSLVCLKYDYTDLKTFATFMFFIHGIINFFIFIIISIPILIVELFSSFKIKVINHFLLANPIYGFIFIIGLANFISGLFCMIYYGV